MSGSEAKNIGYVGENAVCGFLERHGYRIVKRNFTIRGGEIDIIAFKDKTLAFVEVKTRRPDSLASGENAITFSKKKNILKTADAYIRKFADKETGYRFDVAVVICEDNKVLKLKYYPNAFDASK